MLKSLAMYEYVDDEFAEYVPAEAQGLPLDLQSAELGVLTQRSLLPVSRCKRRLCDGVPNVPLAKYNVSYFTSVLGRHVEFSVHTSLANDAWTVFDLLRSRSLDTGFGTDFL
jgi:hypothetical protein